MFYYYHRYYNGVTKLMQYKTYEKKGLDSKVDNANLVAVL